MQVFQVFFKKVCRRRFEVKNFLGEKSPRNLKFDTQNVKVKIEGDKVVVEGNNKEAVGQTDCAGFY